jgi:hypothetical protein
MVECDAFGERALYTKIAQRLSVWFVLEYAANSRWFVNDILANCR